ncbi:MULTISPECIES: septation protein A [Deefgea]|uniref:Inner membrane-spanning protein YciB n=1 Tax=Deefgea chitinilytica TaxID=570276 RepID=A0ABS2CCF9_9NEIS|nr:MULTISPECIES: septation protein A [Deefgea]MBM5571345.1 septation protein A [Deefgea chitinilytica]MBM9888578.1 septation protein A [Deefgea sp. CFH1-16]
MKFLFDLFPILLFFGAYSFTNDIYFATGVTIAAATAQVAYCWIRHRHVEKMLLISFVMIAVLGGMTIIFHNKQFIMWKPTVLYWFFAVLIMSMWHLKQKNLIEAMMGTQIALPRPIWTRVMYAWVVFCVVLGALNIFVFHNYSEAIWVKFKVFGTLVLTLAFFIAQFMYFSKYILPEDENQTADSE